MAVLWLRFLTEINEDTDEVPAELLENADINKALGIVEKSAMTEEQLYAYERFWDAVNRESVLAEGKYAEGRAEGERNKAHDIAKNLKALGMSVSDISKSTGLSPDEIEKL